MKSFFAILCLAVAFTSCNNADNKTSEAKTEDKSTTEVKLPFTLENPYQNWAIGSTENVAAAMNTLKAYIDNDNAAFVAGIGDSITLDFDMFQATLSRDSAIKFFATGRTMYNDLTVTMYDYVSVISADKKTEWVTLWYKQNWKNEKGVADSMNVVNDIRLEKGKMVELSEKVSHYQKK